ncbi:hypothetical protein [Thermodesulforhabdus norvegica]|uniref:FlgN protein n=1 Tax=Thermodesulforhabdus norvegica TaxID=39841 RepID=A0A1I4R579_9BACT|nr:hypothetical protein [Thermodesulforhabdus norvegica]SFM47126.1 hypothetical protein SAMN05660836_00392 [Thermodesulforhabdus norvegica]
MNKELARRLICLKDILEEEKRCLREKAWDRFPGLMGEKLALLSEIREIVEKNEQNDRSPGDPEVRNLAREIRKINESNRLYIEEMLSFYQGILSLILPDQYNVQGLNKPSPLCTRGLAVHKEA